MSMVAHAQPVEPPDYDAMYSKCTNKAGTMNNMVVSVCSNAVSTKAKQEITAHYKSIYHRLLKYPHDAQKLESSQKAWIEYRDGHCSLAGAYVGSPMYDFCPMNLNSARALELRELDQQ
ncbi:MAG: DUF1311 domain-containing protein [Moraxellaceae bacterium]|nr:MAG: DUF1311 domain-containing protein [Moraxellaceae bacterium]